MTFSYDVYYDTCFVEPVFGTLFFGTFFVCSVVLLIREIVSHKVFSTQFFSAFICLLMFALCLSVGIGRLAHGGTYLAFEKESDAIEMSGEIRSFKELGYFSFPNISSSYGYEDTNSVQIDVDGVLCTAIGKGDFEIGDHVTILYLPKSGYVLAIKKGG